MTAPHDETAADHQSIIAELRAERDAALAREALRESEYKERTAHQQATNAVLRAMLTSPADPQPVFEIIVQQARALLPEVILVGLFEYDGELVHFRANARGLTVSPASFNLYKQGFPRMPDRGSVTCRAILERTTIHIRDLETEPGVSQAVKGLGHRTQLSIPFLRDGRVIGALSIGTARVDGLSVSQIELLQTFAEQAVIAITSAETYRSLQSRTTDLQESLEYQTAISDVLKVISRSTFDLQPVLDRVAETAARLCDADWSVITRRHGEVFRAVATCAASAEFKSWIQNVAVAVDGRQNLTGRVVVDRQVVHIEDVTADPEYNWSDIIRLWQPRSALGVPLWRDGEIIGTINLIRQRVAPFDDDQITLVTTFADQAVIAMENARLLAEQREALEQQTATADVLRVINANPGNVTPVFETILDKAHSLCGAHTGSLSLYNGQYLQAAALHGYPEEHAAMLRQPYSLTVHHHDLISGKRICHIPDLHAAEELRDHPVTRNVVQTTNLRTVVLLPLRKEETVLGFITAFRPEVRPFSEKEITLLESFAAQAVIAIENARLITEQRDALEQQTATAEVLQVINANPGNLTPVFDAMLEKAVRLCTSAFGVLCTYDGQTFKTVAVRGVEPALMEFLRRPLQPRPGGTLDRVVRGEDVVQVADITEDEAYRSGSPSRRALADLGGGRTQLLVALRVDQKLLGTFVIFRQEVRPFTVEQVALLNSFAAQAVIAMENARLLNEVRQRQEELRITFENMGDGVAMFDRTQQLIAWNGRFQETFDLPASLLRQHRTYKELLGFLAARGDFGPGVDAAEQIEALVATTGAPYGYERTRPDGRVIEIRRNPVPDGGFVLIFSDITERKRSEEDIGAARDVAEAAYRDLQAAQDRLVQTEKMASLGQLTAGIAHEIKNPLNFVNNFAVLSVDLLDELKAAAEPAFATLDDNARADVEDLTETLTSNLRKIEEHGKRADGIVRSMLEHSRASSSERRAVDLNALINEALNLAYHGARAQDQGFTVKLERDLAAAIPPIEANPQDLTRVFLNLFSNGFYAITQRARTGPEAGYVPTLTLTTCEAGDAVEIRVRDNGTGVPGDIRDKLFQPFFTTKPTGEGTGLGLSISYDIVTKQHGGSITVDSEPGAFTEFVVALPRSP